MNQIKFSDFQVIPVISSAKRADISDEIYFSSKYAKYISNSKMSNICPIQGGSMQKYYGPSEHLDTSSLTLGSAIHCCTLQSDKFTLAPKCNKPTSKLGKVCDLYVKYIKKGFSKEESARKAALDTNYYVNILDSKLDFIIKSADNYYNFVKDYDSSYIVLDDKSWDTATKCINNLKADRSIQVKLHPTDMFDTQLPSYNEDTLFLDFIIIYQGKLCTTLRVKGKLDNWTIDENNKIVTLNDLKTTGHPVAWFMNQEYGSFYKYR